MRERLFGPACQLAFTDHVYQLDASQGGLCGLKRLEPEHGAGDALDRAMALLHDII